jgi:hypothetical protein
MAVCLFVIAELFTLNPKAYSVLTPPNELLKKEANFSRNSSNEKHIL